MDFQVKLFSWPDRGNHLILITRGLLDIVALEQIFQEVTKVTHSLLDCKVMMDLQDAICDLKNADIQAFVDGMTADGWPSGNKVAVLSPREIEQYEKLSMLTSGLSKLGYQIALFYESKTAVSWLADTV